MLRCCCKGSLRGGSPRLRNDGRGSLILRTQSDMEFLKQLRVGFMICLNRREVHWVSFYLDLSNFFFFSQWLVIHFGWTI